jgi:hypothetical protein
MRGLPHKIKYSHSSAGVDSPWSGWPLTWLRGRYIPGNTISSSLIKSKLTQLTEIRRAQSFPRRREFD